MTALDLARAPPPARPLRWLSSAPAWGMASGAWLLAYGGDALASRWAPATVVLTHLFTLGVLGNAMLGSLQQFLPVAAASALPLGRAADWLHVAFNLGLALFVPALMRPHPGALALAATLLAVPLLAFAGTALAALSGRIARRVLHAGLGLALGSLSATALLGVLLVMLLRGDLALPLDRIADAHAAIGLLGWTLGLIAAVASLTLPMFQGTAPVPPRWLGGWLALVAAGLVAGAGLRIATGSQAPLALAVALPALAFAGAVLWLQRRAMHPRNPALVGFWRLGAAALAAAAVLLPLASAMPAIPAMLAGILAVGIALPALLVGMLLEIVGFLAWIGLRGACPRGVRIPGTGTLLPEADKRRALIAHAAAAPLLACAVPYPALAHAAGLALLLAYALTFGCLLRCLRRARRFQRTLGETR